MPSNMPKSSLVLHRINPHAPSSPPPSNSLSSIPTTCKQSQQPPSPSSGIRNNFNRLTTEATALRYYCPSDLPETVARHHIYRVGPNQCCSAVIQEISAPVPTVWSVVRRFDNPQAYKSFIKSCRVVLGNGGVGTLREVDVVSGLPAENSTEKLEILDDEQHVISFSVVGGDHRLCNYRSVTTLHQSVGGKTVVVESYIVDVPVGNTQEETCIFVDTIVRCNLQSLAKMTQDLARESL